MNRYQFCAFLENLPTDCFPCALQGSQSMTSSKENVSPAEEEDYEGHDEHEHEHEHEHEQPHPNPPSLPPRHDRSVSGGSNHAPRFMQATTAWKGETVLDQFVRCMQRCASCCCRWYSCYTKCSLEGGLWMCTMDALLDVGWCRMMTGM